ncbi:TRAP transporter small permease [Photobacterium minamisatsumaniensis]|uniref:TRAP transporter small permease n=1 Tax=Photobacterium minamisatsumaniensis TaxID=2910233 RepID=UPI003D0E4C6D
MENQEQGRIQRYYSQSILCINKIEGAMLISCVLLMAFNNVANVTGRVLFNQSLFFTEELNSILIIMITFAGTSYAARKGSHIRMTAVFDCLPHVYQKFLLIIISFFTSACVFAICYFSVEYISWIAPKGKILPALQIPVYLTYLWVPVSLFLTGLEYFITGLKNIKVKGIHLASQVEGNGYEEAADL